MELEKGTTTLIKDLESLIEEAKNREFGDFTNQKYPAPKIALAERFLI